MIQHSEGLWMATLSSWRLIKLRESQDSKSGHRMASFGRRRRNMRKGRALVARKASQDGFVYRIRPRWELRIAPYNPWAANVPTFITLYCFLHAILESKNAHSETTHGKLCIRCSWMNGRNVWTSDSAWMMECDWLNSMTKWKDVNRIRMLAKQTFREGSESLHVVAMRHSKFH